MATLLLGCPCVAAGSAAYLWDLTNHYSIDVVRIAVHHAIVGRDDLRDRAHPLPHAGRRRSCRCRRVVCGCRRDAANSMLGLGCWGASRSLLLVILLVGSTGWCAGGGGGSGGSSCGAPGLLLLSG